MAPGSAVLGEVGRGEFWSGSPAEPISRARGPWSSERPARSPRWVLAYAGLSTVIAALPVLALAAGLAVALPGLAAEQLGGRRAGGRSSRCCRSRPSWPVPRSRCSCCCCAGCSAVGLAPGHYPIHSRQALQAWATLRVLDEARTWLFPLYASSLTPAWLRLLGARIGARWRRRPCC